MGGMIMTVKTENEKNVSSLDLLWNQAFQEVDAWVERANYREEVIIQSAKQLAESVKRNQKNRNELTEQFSKELGEWEKKSREELLSATTGLQYLFPLKSYEEINKQLDQVQSKTGELTAIPFRNLANGENVDSFVAAFTKYIEFIQKNRNQYVTNMKETASIIQNNQRAFMKVMTNQVKNMFFPFHKYMERSNELTKS
jgi:hypothetical protein